MQARWVSAGSSNWFVRLVRGFLYSGKISFYTKALVFFMIFFLIAGAIFFVFERESQNKPAGPGSSMTGAAEEQAPVTGSNKAKSPEDHAPAAISEAYWQLMVYSTTGMESFGPKTLPGKVIAMSVFLMGVAYIALFTARFASAFVVAAQERRREMPDLDRHFAICNWNQRGDRIIRELHNVEAEPETEIVVVTDVDVKEQELRRAKEYEKVYFISGDPTLHDVLRGARVHLAKSVIILAGDECPDPDGRTALIALAISKLEQGQGQKPHIVAEVKNHKKIQHLLDAGVDEWVCAADFGLGIIAQSALAHKISQVYQELLQYGQDSNEIYMLRKSHFPSELVGKTFPDAIKFFADNRDDDNPAIPIGVKRGGDGKIILNPRSGDFGNFADGDELIVMSFRLPTRFCKNSG